VSARGKLVFSPLFFIWIVKVNSDKPADHFSYWTLFAVNFDVFFSVQYKDRPMPAFEVIKASEALGVPKKQSNVAHELLDALNGLKKDEVLKLTPDEGKSVRGKD
jgi:hypothetical protein